MNKYEALYQCDKYDYFLSAFCGITAGIIDVIFVNRPDVSRFGNISGDLTDSSVKAFAKMCGWNDVTGKNSIASAIGFLERKFPVSYDRTNANFIDDGFRMGTVNHHIKSLAHSPDIIGLFFAIVDQFSDTSTFISDGQLFILRNNGLELQGGNLVAKIVCGVCNWFGHLMSDVAGSSGSRGNSGTGTGIPLPFYNMFLLCNTGSFTVGNDRQTLAVVMTRAFQEGYDLRHGIAASMPLILNEILIRCFWALNRHYCHGLSWSDCIPKLSNPSLHKMLIVGDGAMCLVDGIVASMKSGGNALTFVLHLNLPAWARFLSLVFKYITANKRKLDYDLKHRNNLEEFRRMDAELEKLKEEIYLLAQAEKIFLNKNSLRISKSIKEKNPDKLGAVLKDMSDVYGHSLQFTNFKEFDVFMMDKNNILRL